MKTNLDISNGIPEGGIAVVQEGNLLRIDFDHVQKQVVDEDGETSEYIECEEVVVRGMNCRTYAAIVAAIVGTKYSADDTFAILANKGVTDASSEKLAEYEQRYTDFQSWRAKAKEVAKAVLELIK